MTAAPPPGGTGTAARLVLAVAAGSVAASLMLAGLRDRPLVRAPDFVPLLALAVFGLFLARGLRRDRLAPRLALALEHVALMGILAMATKILSVSLLPFSRPPVDHALMSLDRAVGFDWPAFVAAMTHWPWVSSVLREVYGSHLLMVGVAVAALARAGAAARLEAMTMTAATATLTGIGLSSIFPSLGPLTVLHALPAGAETLLAGQLGHAALLLHAAEHGITWLRPEHLAGFIAFPSFHIIIALLAVWFARGTPAFLPLAAAGAAMVPATILHGAHHLVDVAGGVAVFTLSALAVRHLRAGTATGAASGSAIRP